MEKVLVHSLLVGLGGFAGSVGRYLVSLAYQQSSLVLPAGTLTVNIAGCFLIGLLAQASDTGGSVSPEARLALAVGFCGGFTTMSSIDAFIPTLHDLFEASGCGGLVTMESVEIIRYLHGAER